MKKLIVSIVLVVLSILFLIKEDFTTDITSMLPLKDKVIGEQYKILSAFNSLDKIVFEISSENSEVGWEELSESAFKFLKYLDENSKISFNANISTSSFFEIRNFLINYWPALISSEDSLFLVQQFTQEELYKRLDKTVSSLFTFSSSNADPYLLSNDPFGFHSVLLKRLSAFSPSDEIRIRDGLLTNKESNKILFIAESKKDAEEREVLKAILDGEKELSSTVNLNWMGAVRASADNAELIKRDINLTLPITISLIFIICLLIYKRWYLGLFTFIPTILGILYVFGVFAAVTNFSMIIVGFAAALMGITVDYAIHYLYYVDSLEHDDNPLETVRTPILGSAFTTAGAFLVLTVSGIPALSQLGIITAAGIITVAILTITILPKIVKNNTAFKRSKLDLDSKFNRFYLNFNTSKFVIPLILLSLIFWSLTPMLQFDGDPDSMNGMKNETRIIEKRLNENWGSIGEGAYLTVTHKERDSLITFFEEKLIPFSEKLKSDNIAKFGGAFTSIIPSKRKQLLNQNRWRLVFNSNTIDLMQKSINHISKKYGISPQPFNVYLEKISNMENDVIEKDHIPEVIKNEFLKNSIVYNGSLWVANLSLFINDESKWEYINNEANKLGLIVINDDVLGFRIVSLIQSAFKKSALFIPLVILLIISFMLKSFRNAIIVFTPTLMATGITLGIMSLCSIKINIVTMMVFAFIFGLGIDYALLIFYMKKKELETGNSYLSHGAASVSVAAGTTLSGLGVLILAQHPVISTLGITGFIGIISSYICAIIIVPFLSEKLNRKIF